MSKRSAKMAPPPPEFVEEFIKGGWRRVEHLYGARTDVIRKWIAAVGDLPELQKMRKESRA